MKLRDISEKDFVRAAWRYFTFPKFISLLTYQALWFAKLKILEDGLEGLIPEATKHEMRLANQVYMQQFASPEFHAQIDEWPERNERDGRELTVASCWFLCEDESLEMWQQYGAGPEAVAVKSTIGRLYRSVYVVRDESVSHMGPVSYVDHSTHVMTQHHAHQAFERAFLKDRARFAHEKELRIATLNIKTSACAAPDGKPYTPEQLEGAGSNNFENPGLYVGVNLSTLIEQVVVTPYAQDWFHLLVHRIIEVSGLSTQVVRSSLQQLNRTGTPMDN